MRSACNGTARALACAWRGTAPRRSAASSPPSRGGAAAGAGLPSLQDDRIDTVTAGLTAARGRLGGRRAPPPNRVQAAKRLNQDRWLGIDGICKRLGISSSTFYRCPALADWATPRTSYFHLLPVHSLSSGRECFQGRIGSSATYPELWNCVTEVLQAMMEQVSFVIS